MVTIGWHCVGRSLHGGQRCSALVDKLVHGAVGCGDIDRNFVGVGAVIALDVQESGWLEFDKSLPLMSKNPGGLSSTSIHVSRSKRWKSNFPSGLVVVLGKVTTLPSLSTGRSSTVTSGIGTSHMPLLSVSSLTLPMILAD